MGKRSTKENKCAYQLAREAAGLTREQASEAMEYISDDRIEKIERGVLSAHPEEVITMSECYKDATLCNYYCSHECPIGQKYIPEVQIKDLSQITLEMLASLNAMEKEKNRLIEITVDGKITDDERPDFEKIQQELRDISISIQSMQMWIEHATLTGEIK
ncbi:MAG: XRE family transcriptional regulator [Lachnospiraceae bacterium]|nr:XRE family transcriptional regulator [Lachnospiraceae bacterium]